MAIGNLLSAFRKQKDEGAKAAAAPAPSAPPAALEKAKTAAPRLSLFDDSSFEEVTHYGDHSVSKSGQFAARSPADSIFEKAKR